MVTVASDIQQLSSHLEGGREHPVTGKFRRLSPLSDQRTSEATTSKNAEQEKREIHETSVSLLGGTVEIIV